MSLYIDPQRQMFHLQSGRTSYVIKIYPTGLVGNVYWGRRLEDGDLSSLVCLADKRNPADEAAVNYDHLQDILRQEYPGYGNTDFRPPAFQVQHADGSTVSDFRYSTHRVVRGKKLLAGLPCTRCDDPAAADTLELDLTDPVAGLVITLSYTMYAQSGALVRSACIRNTGAVPVTLLRALSMGIDLPPGSYDVINLGGTWARERHVQRSTLAGGTHLIDSTRGMSSHQQNPFMALCEHQCTETAGEAYGFNLIYSGNFLCLAEVDQFATVRVVMGVNPFDFSWRLEPGEAFQTPEAVLAHSSQGLGDLSRSFHSLYRDHLVPAAWAHRERPILINNWEATYFGFTHDKIVDIARVGAELGLELFVLDDGWFGHRDSDNSSLGDWFEDRKKLPRGLKGLAQDINALGLQFGLWFEPEMISPDSELYRAHPDWCLHIPGRHRTQVRNQLVLDLSRREVCDAIIAQVSQILSSVNISYVKWDMNRPLTEMGSAVQAATRQRETAHRYVLGVYYMMETITRRFPNVLFEGCAGGGSRFDPGILHYMPQIWTSDDSDAIERLKIQWGTSLCYPASVMGAHVSAVPNHQVGRQTPLSTRGNVAMSGIFGYELDLTKLSEAEKTEIKAQVAFCKQHRHLVLDGAFHRLKSPFEGNETAWMLVSPDAGEALVMVCRVLGVPNPGVSVVRLQGLDPAAEYQVDGPFSYRANGSVLMHAGLRLPGSWGDFNSWLWTLKRVD